MITNSQFTEVEQIGTLDSSHAQTLGIDVSGIAAILNILTNMYSNPSLAVVREYSCNARDSHVEAGKANVPIELTLPTSLDPQLKIQDCGTGLTEDQILNVYAKYGSSTKRESNEFIGAMGIGSKSAFTVGNQFTVTGVKDGIKTVALFALNDKGEPTVDILVSGQVTDEPNGVLVEIGVEKVGPIRTAAVELFRTWDQGTVLVDGERPHHVWAERGMNSLGNNIYLLLKEQALTGDESHVNIVMGGINYRLYGSVAQSLSTTNRQLLNFFYNTQAKFYIDVPIGSVDITPSREELRVTPTTTATIEDVLASLAVELPRWINREIQVAPTFIEAAMLVRKFRTSLNFRDFGSLRWRGKPFGTDVIKLPYQQFVVTKRGRYRDSPRFSSASASTLIGIDMDVTHYIFVTNTPVGKEHIVRRYVKAILMGRPDFKDERTIVVATPLAQDEINWFSYGEKDGIVPTISYEDWCTEGKSYRKTGTGVTRSQTTYDVQDEDEPMIAADILAVGLPVVYFPYRGRGRRYTQPFVKDMLKDHVIVNLRSAQKPETFLKRIPTAELAANVAVRLAKAAIDAMTPADHAMFASNSYLANVNRQHMDFLVNNKRRITNQEVLNQVKLYEEAKKSVDMDIARLRFLQKAAGLADVQLTTSDNDAPSGNFVAEKLPLLATYLDNSYRANNLLGLGTMRDNCVRYINLTNV